MRAFRIVSIVFLLGSAAAAAVAAPCTPSATAMCLAGGRFEVRVAWKDFAGNTGAGQANVLTPDTGYFWFFSSSNVELVVKVLDARGFNNKFWVFFGALSNVEYTLTVTDTVTRAVKTYVNPSGRFASVGDTAAFDGGAAGAVPAARRMVIADGTDSPPASLAAVQKFIDGAKLSETAAFSACPDLNFGFNLGGCRFHLEVEWSDGRGGTGYGQPVQLTNDTGYFWFFSANNVELVVKVLDARAVDGKFWVFFGALTNVEYSLTVTDTLTGNVRRYRNPAGQFASVGDTAAFRGGVSVAPVLDAGHAASKDIDQRGGLLTATGADGSLFTLLFPPNSLTGPTTVTMTPVSRIDRIPFSGGLIAGVELEPEGLRLNAPATLTIRPAVQIPANRILPYGYLGRGEDFILYPRTGDASSITLPVLHFSGTGIGQGNASEASKQPAEPPAGKLAPYQRQIASWKFLQLINEITADEFLLHLHDILDAAWTEVVKPDLDEAKENCDKAQVKSALLTALELTRLIQVWGLSDIRLEGLSIQVLDYCVEILKSCDQKAYERCVARNDPYEAALMVFIAAKLQEFGVEDPYLTTFAEGGLIESCLRFELDLQSKFVEFVDVGGFSMTKRMRYRSEHVPLRFQFTSNPYVRGAAWDGECTLVPELATMEFNRKPCTVECRPGNSRTTVYAMWLDGLGSWDPTTMKPLMIYNPGAPIVLGAETCPLVGTAPFYPLRLSFGDQFSLLHEKEGIHNYGEIAEGFVARDWDLLRVNAGPSSNGEFFAKKSYERSKSIGSQGVTQTIDEETHLFLKHTPGKPMPSCPP